MSYAEIKEYIQSAYSAPGWAWAVAITFVVCFVWRKLPQKFTVWKFTLGFPNEALWLVCLAVGSWITLELAPDAPKDFDEHKWRLVNIFLGIIVGFLTRVLFVVILGRIESKFPLLKQALEGPENTTFFKPAPDLTKNDLPPTIPKP